MHNYQREFIEFAIYKGALCFGQFVLKSGRQSPYFFNTGCFDDSESLWRMGQYYAATIEHSGIAFDMLFGTAYKGIPLVCAAAIALQIEYGKNYPYCCNRKEHKDHGEGGVTFGAPLAGRVLIVDDVISAGTALREALRLMNTNGAKSVGVTIALDRQEPGNGAQPALVEMAEQNALQIDAIISLDNITTYLTEHGGYESDIAKINLYRKQYLTADVK